MANTISIDAKAMQNLLARLDKLSSDVAFIKERLLRQEAPYGSDEWWAQSIKQSEEDFKARKFSTVKNKKELKAHLNSLR